ncbi:MAG: hypothetical protein F6K47_24225 [Symploca sp. SIO2E6]|nr:hypothetical protein [Symploca sp. SIO2E6]
MRSITPGKPSAAIFLTTSSINIHPPSNDKRQTTNNKRQTTNDKQQTTNDKQQTTILNFIFRY